jgi:hypothetical protein
MWLNVIGFNLDMCVASFCDTIGYKFGMNVP